MALSFCFPNPLAPAQLKTQVWPIGYAPKRNEDKTVRDRDVRLAVLRALSAEHGADTNTRIVEEMGIWSGTVRIDVAVINGRLSGFELKSNRDTLDRLPSQVELYSRVFDHVFLVAGEKHATRALDLIPAWWGLTVATCTSCGIALEPVRKSDLNPSPDLTLLAKLLWKDEALAILDARGLAKGWRSKSASAIHSHLAAELPHEDLSAEVRAVLKARKQWLGQSVGDERQVTIDSDLDPALPAP